jgi:hypothetical protein
MPDSVSFGRDGQLVSSTSPLPVDSVEGLNIPLHDYVGMSYTGSNLTSITYKTGGSSGTVVATLTLAYDGSNNLTSVTKV